MICREICATIDGDEADLSSFISYLQLLGEKSKCRIELCLKLVDSKLKVKACCLKSKSVIRSIELRLRTSPYLRTIPCKGLQRKPREGVPVIKLNLGRGRDLCIGIEEDTLSPFCIPSRELYRHVLIVGSSGSGKSTTVKRILRELGKDFLVFDWHGEYDLQARKVSCVDLSDLSSFSLQELMDMFSMSLELSDAQYYVLFKVLQLLNKSKRKYGLIDVIVQIHTFEETSRWIKETKHSILRKLEMLRHEGCLRGAKLSEIWDAVRDGVIINMEGYSEYAKRFLTALILSYTFRKLSSKVHRRRVFAVLEEAQNVASKTASYAIFDKVFQEGRKYGLHLIAVTQSPKNLNEAVVKNTSLKVIHKINEASDAKYISESIGRPELWKEVIGLGVGEAIVSYGSMIFRVMITPEDRLERSTPILSLRG